MSAKKYVVYEVEEFYAQDATSNGQPARKKCKNGQQGTASLEEQRERIDAMRTMGRKGCRAPRINLAFSGPNYDFVNVMSRVRGQSLTQYVNSIIDQYRKEHSEVYEKILRLRQEGD